MCVLLRVGVREAVGSGLLLAEAVRLCVAVAVWMRVGDAEHVGPLVVVGVGVGDTLGVTRAVVVPVVECVGDCTIVGL